MTSTPILITKRDGTQEPIDLDKLHKVVQHACNGINGVSPSEVELQSQLQFYNGMKSSAIQEILIKAASELISEDAPNYQYVAGRLINYQLRKNVYGSYEPHRLYQHVLNVIAEGYYTDELVAWYDDSDWEKMQSFIDHERDEKLTYVAMEQFRGKYLAKDRTTGQIFETPQMAYMLIAATTFHAYPKETRMKYVRDYYDAISEHYISLPTPQMAGLRTPQKQFSSCVTIACGDSLDSINATASAIVKYVSQKAGIGLNVGRIRALGSPIRKGDTYHTGMIPFLKYFQSATKSCSQGGIRNGSTTCHFPIWHLEIEDLIVLKNNKGTDDNRIRHMDYSVQINKLFYDRLIEGKDITLFCPNDMAPMYDAFFADQDKFKQLYEAAEQDPAIRKKKVKAFDLFSAIIQERKDTGRIYIMNVDQVNEHGAYFPDKAPIVQSNLCQEITIPTKPLNDINDEEGLIGLCTLGAINWGKIDSPEDFKKPCELIVRALDELLSYQEYPVKAAQRHTTLYRPLGVGVNNFAYWMAKNGLTYDGNKETYDTVDEFMEAWSYYLIKASCDLAKEKTPNPLSSSGPHGWSGIVNGANHSKYNAGILPIDTYNKNVDKITKRKLEMNWDELRENLKAHGIRNTVLMAQMPCETSAQISNSTNGIEPPRGYISYKQSKDGTLKQVVPGFPRLKNKYQLLWDIKSPEGYLKICAIMQKYIDQSMSVNTSYNPKHYENGKLSMKELITHILEAYKYGVKCLYYCNINDQSGEEAVESKILLLPKIYTNNILRGEGCESGACTL